MPVINPTPIQPSESVLSIASEIIRCVNQTPRMVDGDNGSTCIELISPSAELRIGVAPNGQVHVHFTKKTQERRPHMADETNIPEKHVEFCKAVARVCKEHGIGRFSASYRPGFGDGWHGEINMLWEQGRHGADAEQVVITSSQSLRTVTKAS